MRTVRITCRNCWKIAALGISDKVSKEVLLDKEHQIRGYRTVHYPSHGQEVCKDCGREFTFPPLAAEYNSYLGILQTDRVIPKEECESVRFNYRGSIDHPVIVQDEYQYLPEEDPCEEQWLERLRDPNDNCNYH